MTSTPIPFPPDDPPWARYLLPGLAVSFALFFGLTRTSASPGLLTGIAGLLAVAYLPGLAASLWIERRYGLWSSWILPLMLSPMIAVGGALMLTWSGLSLEQSASWIVSLALLAVALAPPPRREVEEWEVSLETPAFLRIRSDRQQVIGVAFILLSLIAIPWLLQDWMGSVGDGLLHRSVALDILRTGIPPEHPLLAGFSYRDPWAFHVYLGLLQGATRLDPGTLLVGGSLIAAFVILFAGYRLLNLLGLSHLPSLCGALFLFLGFNGLSWAFNLWPAAEGIPGAARSLLEASPVSPVAHAATPLALAGSSAFFLECFLSPSPLLLGLTYLLLFGMAAFATLGESRIRWDILTFFGAVGLLLFHTNMALMVLAVTVISVPVILFSAGISPWKSPGRHVLGLLLPVALAGLVTSPYLSAVYAGGAWTPWQYLDISPARALWWVKVLLPSLAFGLPVLVWFLKATEVSRQAWTIWSVLLLVVSLVVLLPTASTPWDSVLPAFFALALVAGAGAALVWQRASALGRVGWTVILLAIWIPANALGFRAYLRAEDPRDHSPAYESAESWIREHTPANAVFVDGSPGLALLADRRLFFARPGYLATLGYAGLNDRRLDLAQLLTGSPLTELQRQRLGRLPFPLYVVHRLPREVVPPAGSEKVFQNEAFVIFRWSADAP